jgi:hypothetical protein
MATTFINYTAQAVGTTTHHMIDGNAKTSNPTGVASLDAGKAQIVIGCMVSNRLTVSTDVTVAIRNAATVTYLCKALAIPAGDAIEVVQGKIVMQASDEIEVSASAASAVDCVLSVLKNA